MGACGLSAVRPSVDTRVQVATRWDIIQAPMIDVEDGKPRQGRYQESSRIVSLAFSAIIMVGALVLPEVIVGMMEASATRRPLIP